ncbi:MAG: small acid-soluble spore protein SspI [Prevotella sp.]|nr:small acid-soluble spore protein SspI [Staphylococcus sp.]MCM1350308.1 small acid-soluble spore protein SspI [Prevotella sp.]
MDINIRNNVLSNLKGASAKEVYDTIQDAITLGEEKVLPGLGVLFELLWQTTDANYKDTLVSTITKAL